MSIARTFRKKPVEIEAIRFTGTVNNGIEIMKWSGDYYRGDFNQIIFWKCLEDSLGTSKDAPCSNDDHILGIRTTEGVMECKPGWYVIKGVEGEFYPCSPSVFAATYELITDESVTE